MNPLTVLDDGRKGRLSVRGQSFLALAESMPIETDEDFQHADKLVTEGQDYIKGVKAFMNPHIERAHTAHKELTGDRKMLIDPFEEGTKLLGGKMASYNYKREMEKQEKREEVMANAKAEQDASCEAQAKELEESGQKEAANAVREMKETAVPVHVDKISDHLMSNTKFKTDWISAITNPQEVPHEYLRVDEAKIQKMARVMKGNISIPGVFITEKQVPVRRGGK